VDARHFKVDGHDPHLGSKGLGTVVMYQLGESEYIAERDPQSLAWLLNGSVPDLV
jgi:hypothetical protein